VLLACLVISLVFHFVVVPLLVGLFGISRGTDQTLEVVYQAPISSLELRRSVFVRHEAVRKAQPLPQPSPLRVPQQPRVNHQPLIRPQTRAVPAREIAEIHPPVLSRPLHHDVARAHEQQTIDYARQQAAFEKTIAQLREQDDPVADAQRPVQPAASQPQRYTFDISKSVGTAPQAEGVLTPVKSWHDGPYDYYYVQYWVQYEDGSTETGYVPWPIRYLPQEDPFLLHRQHFPLPGPLPDFALPPDTNVHPLIAFCLQHREELSNCPIHHD
jgi:hypothetical protein